jgi:hypothetical protein
MYARVARWAGGDPDAIRGFVERVNADAGSGPPEGVPAKGFLLLADPDGGRSIAITLFETEDDMRQGDATLNAMSPGSDAVGQRAAVELYEVGAEFRL